MNFLKTQCLLSSEKLDNKALLANPSWQWVPGTAAKRCLKFSRDIVLPASLTHVACLGPRRAWVWGTWSRNLSQAEVSNLKDWQVCLLPLLPSPWILKDRPPYKCLLFRVESLHCSSKENKHVHPYRGFQSYCVRMNEAKARVYIQVTFTCWSMFLSCALASWSAKYQDLRNWTRTWDNSSAQHLLAAITPVMETTSPWGENEVSLLYSVIHTHRQLFTIQLILYVCLYM